MSIELDWNIDADKSRPRKLEEDPSERRARRRALIRLFLSVAILLALAVLALYLISQRLKQVEQRLEQLLRDTVDAEVAALRIGDRTTFLSIQRSATNDWLITQENNFRAYQAQKVSSDVQLTGRIADVVIDGTRGRVQVEEIENGIPYLRTWYYWNYDEIRIPKDNGETEIIPAGWYHVPPDYTFWGEAQVLQREHYTVRYQMMDELLAQQMAEKLDAWWLLACSAFDCTAMPPMTVDIVAVPLPEITWADNPEAWQMVVPSPYVTRARADMPFDVPLQIQAATLLANKWVDRAMNNLQPEYPADAYYLKSAVVSWLVGQFVQMDTGAYLIESLARNYGTEKIGQLLAVLQPTADMSALSVVVNTPDLAQANLDWRDFLTWRLKTEDDLIARRDEANWLRLVATHTDAARSMAYARFNATLTSEEKIVGSVNAGVNSDGLPQLEARVRVGVNNLFREEVILFVLINNVWLRAG
jgi:hypothetical protein